MKTKCKRGQHPIGDRCMSETAMRKMINRNLYSTDWQKGGSLKACIVEDSWSSRSGVAVVGKGRDIRLLRGNRPWTSSSRCVFPKDLTLTELKALSTQFLRKR